MCFARRNLAGLGLIGQLPQALGQAAFLKTFSAAGNQFGGVLPDAWGANNTFTLLHVVDLTNNSLLGELRGTRLTLTLGQARTLDPAQALSPYIPDLSGLALTRPNTSWDANPEPVRACSQNQPMRIQYIHRPHSTVILHYMSSTSRRLAAGQLGPARRDGDAEAAAAGRQPAERGAAAELGRFRVHALPPGAVLSQDRRRSRGRSGKACGHRKLSRRVRASSSHVNPDSSCVWGYPPQDPCCMLTVCYLQS